MGRVRRLFIGCVRVYREGLRAGRPELRSLLYGIHICSGAHPASHLLGTGNLSLGCESDYTAASSAEVKNGEAILHSPSHLHGIVLNYLSTQGNFALMMRNMGAALQVRARGFCVSNVIGAGHGSRAA
jgi:hypothetical protein